MIVIMALVFVIMGFVTGMFVFFVFLGDAVIM